MIYRLDTRRPAGHAAGLSQIYNRLSGPVSTVFLCPHAGTPNFGVADGNRTPAQVGNTVAGCYRPERAPIPGMGINLSKSITMKKTTKPGATLRVRLTDSEAAAFAALCEKDGMKPCHALAVLARWAAAQNSLCPVAKPDAILAEVLGNVQKSFQHAVAQINARLGKPDDDDTDGADWWKDDSQGGAA